MLYVHAVGTLEETDGLLKDLIRSALSLVIHKICKFKTFLLLLSCSILSSDMCVYVCVCVCVCERERKVSLMLKINSTTDNGFLFLPF